MVGGCALRICLENPDVSLVTAIGRSRTGIDNAGQREILVDDFIDYSELDDTLENQDWIAFTGMLKTSKTRITLRMTLLS